MRRKILGVLAIGFILLGLALKLGLGTGESGEGSGGYPDVGSMAIRVGVILAAVWLAIPPGTDQIAWPQLATRAGGIGLLVLLVSTTKLRGAALLAALMLILAIGFVLYILRPPASTSRRRSSGPGR